MLVVFTNTSRGKYVVAFISVGDPSSHSGFTYEGCKDIELNWKINIAQITQFWYSDISENLIWIYGFLYFCNAWKIEPLCEGCGSARMRQGGSVLILEIFQVLKVHLIFTNVSRTKSPQIPKWDRTFENFDYQFSREKPI